ncbi:hypothetical protein [Vogesella sp. LIG4]|uniref:hypothetical protein n=1 Tax=Vogesella sp. LIG4 TaxID=1192162 RepID=UPI00081FBE18|nr:hypothetical protein [Vogesella sp. LIG4]SCK15946.1 hypothetical protein PSELUDRAFT_1597 [Vogesella sp. LIG4]
MPATQRIWLQRAAPAKPAFGAPCNGCGVCCASAPCPLSRLLLRHRHGPCPALIWQADAARYHCGLLTAPRQYLHWLPAALLPAFGRLARRYLAIGHGCDAAVEAWPQAADDAAD